MTQATARAHPNIALIKYWGKADEALVLPAAGSLSMTLDIFPTVTTVTVDDTADADAFTLGGAPGSADASGRVARFLDIVRALAGDERRARVDTVNSVPTGAGLASSASGFAALAVAASAAYGLDLDARALSRLARRGSGSASRSIVPRYAVWWPGDDAASFAEPVEAPELAMVVATVDAGEKEVSSRVAMRRTAETSPFHSAWISSTSESLDRMLAACRAGDVEAIGALTELNALRMHADIQASEPPIRYLAARSVEIFDRVRALRADGVGAWATADAGPNVCVISRPADAPAVVDALAGLAELHLAHPGPGAELIEGAP